MEPLFYTKKDLWSDGVMRLRFKSKTDRQHMLPSLCTYHAYFWFLQSPAHSRHQSRNKSRWAYGKEEILTWKSASADGLTAPRVKWPPSMTMLVRCSLEAAFLYTISSTVSRPIRRMTLTDLCTNQVRAECDECLRHQERTQQASKSWTKGCGGDLNCVICGQGKPCRHMSSSGPKREHNFW